MVYLFNAIQYSASVQSAHIYHHSTDTERKHGKAGTHLHRKQKNKFIKWTPSFVIFSSIYTEVLGPRSLSSTCQSWGRQNFVLKFCRIVSVGAGVLDLLWLFNNLGSCWLTRETAVLHLLLILLLFHLHISAGTAKPKHFSFMVDVCMCTHIL